LDSGHRQPPDAIVELVTSTAGATSEFCDLRLECGGVTEGCALNLGCRIRRITVVVNKLSRAEELSQPAAVVHHAGDTRA
jgi:hypothetical protein